MKAVSTRAISLAVLFGLGLALVPRATLGQCIDYGDYLHWVGDCSFASSYHLHYVTCVETEGEYAYLTRGWEHASSPPMWSGEFQVISIDDPSSPQIVGTLSYTYPLAPRRLGGVAVAGDYAYLVSANGHDGWGVALHVVDISDPTAPHEIAVLPHGSGWHDNYEMAITVSGDYVYVVTRGGFIVIDVTVPSQPHVVGSTYLGFDFGMRCELAVAGHYVYVANDFNGGFHIVDVSDPSSPVVVGSVGGDVFCVAISGSYAYVGGIFQDDPGEHLRIIDVSDPTAPQTTAGLAVPYLVVDADVIGDRLYVAGHTGPFPPPSSDQTWTHRSPDRVDMLGVIDISDPTSPQLLGGTPLPVDRPGLCTLAADDQHTYFGSRFGLDIFDTTMPDDAPFVGAIDLYYWGRDVAISGDYAYVPERRGYGPAGRLRVIDVVDPTAPQSLATVDIPGILSVGVEQDYAHVGAGYGYSGVQELYVGNPNSPQIMGSVSTPAPVRDIAASGSTVYAAADWLYAIDISDPLYPQIVGGVDTPGGRVGRVAIAGDYAYLTDFTGLRVVDVSKPTFLQVIGSIDIPGWSTMGVTVAGQYAYVTTGEHDPAAGRLHVIDIGDPASPQLTGSVATRATAWGVAVNGNYAYIAGGGWDSSAQGSVPGLLQVFDVLDPIGPHIIGTGGVTFGSVAVEGNLVYAPQPQWWVNFTGGLYVYPAQCDSPVPVRLSGFTADVQDRGVVLSWHTSFESMHDGFNVYRSRTLKSGYTKLNEHLLRGRSPYSYLDAFIQPSTTYFYKLGAVDLDGHEVLHDPISVATPAWGSRTELTLASPSPFRKETVLSFTLASPAQARLAVYDVVGRLVRVLVDDELPVGDYDATWDGRDDVGLRVAGGTYFVKLTARDVSQTRKVVYLGGK